MNTLSIYWKRFQSIWMIWIEAFWIDYYHGHLNCLNISEKQNNFDKPQLAVYVCQGTCYGAFTSMEIEFKL